MTTCPKCHYTRSPEDPAPDYKCPKCGAIYAKAKALRKERPAETVVRRKAQAENSRNGKVIISLLLVGLPAFIYARLSMSPPPAQPIHTNAPPLQDVVQNSAFDGSVRQVERHLRRTLKDPESFQAIQWFPVQKDLKGFTVRVIYRARNSLGGMVLEDRVFLLDRAGNVIP